MKKENGITLIALVITIVVLLILTGITYTAGGGLYEYSKVKVFLSELKVVQSQVNIVSEKIKLGNTEYLTYGRKLTTEEQKKYINGPLQNVGDSLSNYQYFTSIELEKINARKVKQDILINFETRDVVSVNGIEINNAIYYRQSDFNEETYNVGGNFGGISKYVTDGLILHYDGINNTGNGHSDTATTWKDLSGNEDEGNLINFNYTTTSGWKENGLKLDGINDLVKTSGKNQFSKFKKGVPFSYGVTFKTQELNSTWCGIISNMNSWGNGGFNISYGTAQGIALGMGTYVNSGINSSKNTNYNVYGTYDGTKFKIYVNGELKNTVEYSLLSGQDILQIGCFYTIPSLLSDAIINNVFFYNRALTQQEINTNYKIDKLKYDI